MSLYILDTDCVSLMLYGNPKIIAKAKKHQIAITIITVQELFNGWIGRINNPSFANNLTALYSKLYITIQYIQTVEVLNFTLEAESCLKKLLKDYPPLRKNRLQKDLRIGAIALCVGAIVITRNQQDFSQIPELLTEDWTIRY